MTTFKFPGQEVETEFETLPEASRKALLGRMVTHFANELSAAEGAFGRKMVLNGAKLSEMTDEQVAAIKVAGVKYRKENPEVVAKFKREWLAEKYQQMLAGELGVRASSGVVIDPVEKEMLRIATKEIKVVFDKLGWALPRGDVVFAYRDFTGNRTQWIERWIKVSNDKSIGGKGEPNEPRIRAQAERNLRNEAALAKRAAQAEVDGEDAGL